jgi:CRP-like cAMP-binding protein
MSRSSSTQPADSHVAQERPANRLLSRLSDVEFQRLAPHLKTISPKVKDVFYHHGRPLEHVYFLNSGVASITTLLSNGSMVETATVGDEGMLGIEAYLGQAAVSQGETMMQVPASNGVTTAEMLSVAAFRRELAEGGTLHEVTGLYAQIVLAQMMQSAGCNALHPVHERCCRWLLQTQDRVHSDTFQLSHEFLAIMLGVRRQTVTVVAGTLQGAGLIAYSHGQIRVLDRAGLEAGSCECYAAIRKQHERLH